MIVGTSQAWVMITMPKMPFPIYGFGYREVDSRKTIRWSPYMEELSSLNSSSFTPMPTESGLAGKKGRCASPIRNLMLDKTGSNYIVPAVLLYIISIDEKNKGKLYDSDVYLHPIIIPRM